MPAHVRARLIDAIATPRPSAEDPLVAPRDDAFELLLALLDAVHGEPRFEAALHATLREVCRRTGWALAEAWVPSADERTLTAVDVRAARDEDRPRFAKFVAATERASFPRGIGLPGRVFVSGRHEWQKDVATLDVGHYKRADLAREAGLHAALAVPVLASGSALAVLVFYMDRAQEADERSVEIVAAVARQLGLVLQQKRSQDAIDRLSQDVLRLSTPILDVGGRVALAPVVGDLDTSRIDRLAERVLGFVERHHTRVLIVDVTGVPTIETAVARALLDLAASARLLGARVVLTGMRGALARTLVHLGVSFGDLCTEASLADGLAVARELADEPLTARAQGRALPQT